MRDPLPGREQRGKNKRQHLLGCSTGITSKRSDETFHLSKNSFTFLKARRHDALHSCQLQNRGRRKVAGALSGVAKRPFFVTKRREIRLFHPVFYFGDLRHTLQMTIVIRRVRSKGQSSVPFRVGRNFCHNAPDQRPMVTKKSLLIGRLFTYRKISARENGEFTRRPACTPARAQSG